MGRPPKRFIKKVPPSGAAPVFKLTLPHRVVHTHLSHLIDTEFEIATSASATHSWQGTIAPRRNKDRSEYTLQGWRLFAEAHRVQPGDQVSFELVTPRRLVVQVISTEDTKQAARGSGSGGANGIQEEPPSPKGLLPEHQLVHAFEPLHGLEQHQPAWSFAAAAAVAAAHNAAQAEAPVDRREAGGPASLRPTGSGESSSQMDVDRQTDAVPGPSRAGSQLPPTTPANPKPHPSTASLAGFQAPDSAVTSPEQRLPPLEHRLPAIPSLDAQFRQQSWPSTNFSPAGMANLFRQLAQHGVQPEAAASPGPSSGAAVANGGQGQPPASPNHRAREEGPAEDDSGSKAEASTRSVTAANTHLNFQLLNLTSTIQALQADLQLFESRAKKAEFEAAQLKLLFGELRVTLDRQSRAVLQAGEALEKLAGKLAAPNLLAAADQPFAEKVLSLQSEMYGCVDKLKSSLLHLMSIEI